MNDPIHLEQIVDQLKLISDSILELSKHLDTTVIWYLDPQWWAIMVALLLGLIGIFQDKIRSLLIKPAFSVSIKLAPPDCHKIAMRDVRTGQRLHDSYYLRFRVTNSGNHQMEDVEVMVSELCMKNKGQYVAVENFLPINLVWAHNHYVTMPKIQPKLFKHCDFGHIVKKDDLMPPLTVYGINQNCNIVLELDTFVKPNTGSHILFPGKYKIKVIFAANNLEKEEKWYSIEIKDAWEDDEKEMLKNNVLIEEIGA